MPCWERGVDLSIFDTACARSLAKAGAREKLGCGRSCLGVLRAAGALFVYTGSRAKAMLEITVEPEFTH